jgi:cytochrome c oxidase subunit 2
VRRKLVLLGFAALTALTAAGAAAAANGGFTPQHAHSPNAGRINQAYYLISGFTLAIFLLVTVTLVTFIVKYRNRGRDRRVEGAQVHGHSRLEIIWTVIPVVIISIIFGFVFYKLPGISGAPTASAANPLEVDVIAHQFYWEFRYPNGAVSIDTVHLPVGKVVKFTVESKDVNHSWWIPQLGGKTDAIAGRTNHVWYRPDRIGTYYGQCAEFCGLFHERMLGRAIVTSEADYRSFIDTQAAKELGRVEWQGACGKCHGLSGQGDYGPAIASNPILTEPSGLEEIVRKGRGRMPGVGSDWSAGQLRALEAYVKQSVYKGAAASGG